MKTTDYYRLTTAAEKLGVPRSTLKSAAERGELPMSRLGDGLPVVRWRDAKNWFRKFGGRPPGKPPKAKPES